MIRIHLPILLFAAVLRIASGNEYGVCKDASNELGFARSCSKYRKPDSVKPTPNECSNLRSGCPAVLPAVSSFLK